ncbi:restriction endonuclease subunit S [Levilactobacillus zymae]|nr:restriction endonuclease subunit S [Levilactobacillus zymae]QFR62227.1 restriction endonuclease subunit S [Levilactobacillus zymae]
MILSEQAPGLLGMTTQIPYDNRFVLNQRVAEIRPNEEIDGAFLSMLINSNQRYFSKRGAGTKVQNISKANVENFSFQIPSQSEQNKIGEVFRTLNLTIASNQKQLDHLKKLKKWLLQNMFA